jgi:hypothetical protein
MEQQSDKKPWQTPELIVLVRSRPEEAVLAGCKMSTSPNHGCGGGTGSCKVASANSTS